MTSARGRLGQWGENQARLHLEARGFQIVATNYRCRWGEVDIVARHGQELVFVEVKTRRGSDFGTPEESITPAKARHLTATAQDYLQTRVEPSDAANTSWRIDLVSVHLDKSGKLQRISHLENVVEV
jgi:putative endonuclease